MTRITDTHANTYEVDCIACAIQSGTIKLPVNRLAETESFVVEQDLEYPIEGFLVVVSKRHILSIDEMSDSEIKELALLLKKTRMVMRKILNVQNITIVQEEDTSTSHFHIWLFPWHLWMLKKWKGKLEDIKPVLEFAKKEMSDKDSLETVGQAAANIGLEFGAVK